MGFVPDEAFRKKFRTTFLFVKNHHIVGMVAVEPTREAVLLQLDTLERSTSPVQVTMGVHTLWVHTSFRGQHVASQLLDVARTKFLYGTPNLSLEEIAFSSPTQAGIAFASRYICREQGEKESKHLRVYDCF